MMPACSQMSSEEIVIDVEAALYSFAQPLTNSMQMGNRRNPQFQNTNRTDWLPQLSPRCLEDHHYSRTAQHVLHT